MSKPTKQDKCPNCGWLHLTTLDGVLSGCLCKVCNGIGLITDVRKKHTGITESKEPKSYLFVDVDANPAEVVSVDVGGESFVRKPTQDNKQCNMKDCELINRIYDGTRDESYFCLTHKRPYYPNRTQDNDKHYAMCKCGAEFGTGYELTAHLWEDREALPNNNGSGNDEDTMPIIETLIKVKEGYNYLDANRDLEALIADRLVEARLEELDALNSIKRCGCMVCDALADRISEIKGGKE